MNINEVIIYILVGFMIAGALDRVLGNRFGLGERFEQGFRAMGPLAMAMIGAISLAPVVTKILGPFVIPIYSFLGADPSVFAGTILANDMGGYQLALELAHDHNAGLFSGLIVASMMGATVVFSIPVALGIIEKKDYAPFSKGVLVGVVTIPLGAFVGGVVAGFDPTMVVKNLIPLIIVVLLIAVGLWKIPEAMIKGFGIFSKGVVAIITLGTAVIATSTLTGITIIPGMAPVWDGIKIVGAIAIVLLGAFPMVHCITVALRKPLARLGKLIGIQDVSVAGLIATLANNILAFELMKHMDTRGKVLNSAFAVSAAFILGDHLGFTAAVNRNFIFPVMVAKLVAGIAALVLAALLTPQSEQV